MITTESINFLESLMSSILGLGIVFLSLIFLAIFVMIVSKAITVLEKAVLKMPVSASVNNIEKTSSASEAINIAIIAATISEERRESVDKFVITRIKKI